MNRFKKITSLLGLLLLTITFFSTQIRAQNTTANEGGDMAFGGAGTAPGQFLDLQDITFDPNGVLYVLEGANLDAKTQTLQGNLRVQKFDDKGKFLGIIDLKTATGIDWKIDPKRMDLSIFPARIAADSKGEVFVTVPGAGKVLEWDATGKFVRAIDLPRAMAITLIKINGQENIAVAPSQRAVVPQNGWTWLGGNKIVILSTDGAIENNVALPQAYENVQDLTADKNGNFYLKTEPNAIYEFSPDGKLLKTFGGNPTTRNSDGSEVLHTVGVDSKGNVYSFTWGNPELLTRFDADGKTVTQRAGQFKWGDPWGGTANNYTPLAVAPDDRIWIASTMEFPPTYVWYKRSRAVPAIVRTRADFFGKDARQTPLRKIGLKAAVTCDLPFNVSYDTNKPVPMMFSIAAANRNVHQAAINWHVFDAFKNEIDKGDFTLPLENGKAAKSTFTWTPPHYGAYLVLAQMTSPEGDLGTVGENVIVTPHYAGITDLPEGSKIAEGNPYLQMWSGLPNIRLHPSLNNNLDDFDKMLTDAEKSGVTVLVQLMESQKDFNADKTREFLERFKGRIKYLEVCNEPNFSGSMENYFNIHKQVYEMAKSIDPNIQVMGPAVVNIDLNWFQKLYDMGLKDVTDIISTHDYEGNETIDPVHWNWKVGQLRAIMAAHGDSRKPIWQTERAIDGMRGNDFQGLVQAIRLSLHQDLLETLGIPAAHDFHFYLVQHGFSQVPTYVWSSNGPMPAVAVMRTRYALTTGLGRTYAGTLDFGPTGNTLYMGVRFAGGGKETIALRNLGTPDSTLQFGVQGTSALDVTDAWGNKSTSMAKGGKVLLAMGQLPIYVHLAAGQKLITPKIDFGSNIASLATFTYSSTTKSPMELLNNGIPETYFAGNPNGGTDGKKVWTGDMDTTPQTLTMSFANPQSMNKIILRTPHADNGYCTLLDFDLDYFDGTTWKPLKQVHRPMPPSEEAVIADANHSIWMDDTNQFAFQFPAVTAQKIRLVVRQTTHGFAPDDRATAWGNTLAEKLMLREVEIYAPAGQ